MKLTVLICALLLSTPFALAATETHAPTAMDTCSVATDGGQPGELQRSCSCSGSGKSRHCRCS